jgi:hypothetical protein
MSQKKNKVKKVSYEEFQNAIQEILNFAIEAFQVNYIRNPNLQYAIVENLYQNISDFLVVNAKTNPTFDDVVNFMVKTEEGEDLNYFLTTKYLLNRATGSRRLS